MASTLLTESRYSGGQANARLGQIEAETGDKPIAIIWWDKQSEAELQAEIAERSQGIPCYGGELAALTSCDPSYAQPPFALHMSAFGSKSFMPSHA